MFQLAELFVDSRHPHILQQNHSISTVALCDHVEYGDSTNWINLSHDADQCQGLSSSVTVISGEDTPIFEFQAPSRILFSNIDIVVSHAFKAVYTNEKLLFDGLHDTVALLKLKTPYVADKLLFEREVFSIHAHVSIHVKVTAQVSQTINPVFDGSH